jgi:hypothetical protein
MFSNTSGGYQVTIPMFDFIDKHYLSMWIVAGLFSAAGFVCWLQHPQFNAQKKGILVLLISNFIFLIGFPIVHFVQDNYYLHFSYYYADILTCIIGYYLVVINTCEQENRKLVGGVLMCTIGFIFPMYFLVSNYLSKKL